MGPMTGKKRDHADSWRQEGRGRAGVVTSPGDRVPPSGGFGDGVKERSRRLAGLPGNGRVVDPAMRASVPVQSAHPKTLVLSALTHPAAWMLSAANRAA